MRNIVDRGLRSQAFFSRHDNTRLEATSGIGGTRTRLLFSGPIAQENLGKIHEKFGTGLESLDYSVPLRKVLNGLKICSLSAWNEWKEWER